MASLPQFIGREREIAVLESAYQSGEAELVSVVGRRRVGKTALVREVYGNRIVFELTGVQRAPRREQLRNFGLQLSRLSGLAIGPPEDWLAAFHQLIGVLEKHPVGTSPVLFFDELPWLATRRSGFLRAFGYFWNSWASRQNLVVVICGSAASWMLQHVVRDRGGLHNRITRRIQLDPLTLHETELFLRSRGVGLDRYQITQLYMALGGIPHYLKAVQPGRSAAQNIDALCFDPSGLLYDEFELLYPALFDKAERHMQVVRALAQRHYGMDRSVLLKVAKLTNGGGSTKVLEELVQSGFVTAFQPFQKNRRKQYYRLTDFFSLFYLRFMRTHRRDGAGTWQAIHGSAAYRTWTGYAFENIGLTHIAQLKMALRIAGIHSRAASFYRAGTADEPGAQIDLVLDRTDSILSCFEFKFSGQTYTLTKREAQHLRERERIFLAGQSKRKQVMWTLVAPFGMKANEHSTGLIQNVVTLDALFRSNPVD